MGASASGEQPAEGVSTAELMAFTIARLLEGVRHVAVGQSSPVPGAGVLLARALSEAQAEEPMRVTILGSRRNKAFTNGGVELFDLAAQGRLDAFFLGGGQIDGQANINLVGVGSYPRMDVRWSGCFGSSYLYYLVPRVILFREEHSRRVLVPRVDFVSAPGPTGRPDYRPGGPHALLTGLCLFGFQRDRRRFVLQCVHPGHTVEEVRDHTGFDFDCPESVPYTASPDAAALALIRGRVREEIAETYPKFAAEMG